MFNEAGCTKYEVPFSNPEVFANLDDIRKILAAGIEHYRVSSEDTPYDDKYDDALYLCAKTRDNEIKLQRATDQNIKNAGVICLGGLLHKGSQISGLAVRLLEFCGIPTDKLKQGHKTILAYQSNDAPVTRYQDVYLWNMNKSHVSEEMEKLAKTIFKHKFCDEKGKLLKPEEIQKFCIFTYSFGARMARMIETELKKLITKARLDLPEEERHDLQDYLNRMHRISIGAPLDWIDRDVKNTIPSTTLLSAADRGIKYRKEFADRFLYPQSEFYPSLETHDKARVFSIVQKTRETADIEEALAHAPAGATEDFHEKFIYFPPVRFINITKNETPNTDTFNHSLKTYSRLANSSLMPSTEKTALRNIITDSLYPGRAASLAMVS